MTQKIKILAFAGSTREASLNKKLVKVAAEIARTHGAEVTFLDLRDLPLPLYDGDLEEKSGLPQNAKKAKELLKSHHAFLIASPEYNSSLSAVLKNFIDWASRPMAGTPPLEGFNGKVAGLLAASTGGLGGLRGLVHLRAILQNIGVMVVPEQHALSKAHEAFSPEGKLTDPKQHQAVEKVVSRLVTIAQKLNN